ncbi:MAG: hypothetical protein ACUVQG_09285 [Thermogutta sp.]
MPQHGSRNNTCRRVISKVWALCIILPGLVGCGGGQSAQQVATGEQAAKNMASGSSDQAQDPQAALQSSTADPISAVRVFLEAVRTGDDDKVVSLFSDQARKQAGQLNRQFAPVGSDTARYEVFEDVEYLAPDGARVRSHWTDLDSRGQPRTDEITWMLRKEANGWRIAGMAAVIFEGEPPLLLDFENMQETLRKVELVSEEIERRQQAAQGASADGQGHGQPEQGSPEASQQNVTSPGLPSAPGIDDNSTMTALKPDEPVSRN